MASVSIIGTGNIGQAFATALARNGVAATLANSRGPESLRETIEALGLKSPTLTTFGGYLPTNPLGEEYFSQVPSRYGDISQS